MKLQATVYVLVALAAATFAVPVTDVKNDLQSLDTQTRALDNDIKQLQGSKGVLAVHTEIDNLGKAVDQAASKAKDIKAPVTESDGLAILTGLKSVKSTILNILNDLVAKKSLFVDPVSHAEVLQDLKNLKSSTSGFEDVLIAAAPADLKSQVTAVKNDLNSGFDSAVGKF